jgi:hypothetical protein
MPRILLLCALILTAAPALAQNPLPASPANPTVPMAPPNGASPPPERIVPPDGSMSDRLSHQKGTITPPNVDPGMKVNPPRDSRTTTPVIPPPGSGNGSVVPK